MQRRGQEVEPLQVGGLCGALLSVRSTFPDTCLRGKDRCMRPNGIVVENANGTWYSDEFGKHISKIFILMEYC